MHNGGEFEVDNEQLAHSKHNFLSERNRRRIDQILVSANVVCKVLCRAGHRSGCSSYSGSATIPPLCRERTNVTGYESTLVEPSAGIAPARHRGREHDVVQENGSYTR